MLVQTATRAVGVAEVDPKQIRPQRVTVKGLLLTHPDPRNDLAATLAPPCGLLQVDDETSEVHDKVIAIELDQLPYHIGTRIDAALCVALASLRDHNHPDGQLPIARECQVLPQKRGARSISGVARQHVLIAKYARTWTPEVRS